MDGIMLDRRCDKKPTGRRKRAASAEALEVHPRAPARLGRSNFAVGSGCRTLRNDGSASRREARETATDGKLYAQRQAEGAQGGAGHVPTEPTPSTRCRRDQMGKPIIGVIGAVGRLTEACQGAAACGLQSYDPVKLNEGRRS